MPFIQQAVAVLLIALLVCLIGYTENLMLPHGGDKLPPEVLNALNMALGALIALLANPVNWLFGSSAGSAAKDRLLANKEPPKSTPPTTPNP